MTKRLYLNHFPSRIAHVTINNGNAQQSNVQELVQFSVIFITQRSMASGSSSVGGVLMYCLKTIVENLVPSESLLRMFSAK